MTSSAQQFDRSLSLLIANKNEALELGDFRVRFQVSQSDVETPNTAIIRVYNLSSSRARELIQRPPGLTPLTAIPGRNTPTWEFSQCTLSAGYAGNVGLIFKGTIKQFRRGKEKNTDSFLEILAADGDFPYNFGAVNTSIPDGHSNLDILHVAHDGLAAAANQIGDSLVLDPAAEDVVAMTGGIYPRGKLAFGLARGILRDLSQTIGARWSIQNGVLVVIPNTGYLQGEPVKLNSSSGLVGIPEATENGIFVTSLLNAGFRVGYPILINEADITQTDIREQFFPGIRDVNLVATVDPSTEGLYRVIVVEHEGDTRGNEWYSHLTCLSIDPSAPVGASVMSG
jgi:hypothetical protein